MDGEFFPWADVDAARSDAALQAGREASAMRGGIDRTVKCPRCGSGDQITWLYFRSPAWTWQSLCGRAGWMAVCDGCRHQVTFSCTVMN